MSYDQQKRPYIAKLLREQVRQKYGGHCAYCGCVLDKMHIDHMIPIYDTYRAHEDQVHAEANLMPSCPQCNNYKNVMDLEWFRKELQKQVERAVKTSVNCRMAIKYNQMVLNEHPIVFFFEKWEQEHK